MKNLLLGILIAVLVIVGVVASALGIKWIGQIIEKNTWGDFKHRITVDNVWYATNEYKIDEKNCIHFTDNYEQKWTWCEKYSVGEYYFYKNSPNWKTVWFGY